VKYLLSKKAEPNVRNKSGSTPLHKIVTCKFDQLQILRLLLKAGADPNIRNNAGKLPEDLATRKVLITELLGPNAVTDEVDVPKSRHGRVIGKEGKMMREIRDQTGVDITVPKKDDPSTKISVLGRLDGVAKAKALILEAVAEKSNKDLDDTNTTSDAFTSVKFSVPKDKHKYIIGAGGRTINEIREETSVQITVPKQDDPESNILLQGESDNIDEAIKRILQITKRPTNTNNGSPRGKEGFRNEGRYNREDKERNNERRNSERVRKSEKGESSSFLQSTP